MNQDKINEIIELNKQFYKNNAEEFSSTRQGAWQGWNPLLVILNDNFKDKDFLSVLDLGCGNGRFYKFLLDHSTKQINYLGIDNNDYMMVEAVLKYEDATFRTYDVLLETDKIEREFDLVTAFGLAHHIPGHDFRLNWFKDIAHHVSKGGFFVFTFWQLDADSRFTKMEVAKDLEDNDYFYGWNDSQDKRYVHIYSEEEIAEITKLLKTQKLSLIETFEADGKSGKLNNYFIFGKDA